MFVEFGPLPISSKGVTANKDFEVTPIEVSRREVALQKNEFTSLGPLSNLYVKTYSPVGGGIRIIVSAPASQLILLLAFLALNLTLPTCVCSVLGELLCITS